MANIQMVESNAREAIYLFELMKKYGVTCSLEVNKGETTDPFISVSRSLVGAEYFESNDGPDAVIVSLGNIDFSFVIGSYSYSKHISDCQIMVCIAGDDLAAWFNSDAVSTAVIEKAKNYREIDGVEIIGDLSEQLFDYFNLNTEEALYIVDHLRDSIKELAEAEKGQASAS